MQPDAKINNHWCSFQKLPKIIKINVRLRWICTSPSHAMKMMVIRWAFERARALARRQTTRHSGKSLIKCPTKFDMYTNEIVAHWQCRRSTQQKTNEFSAHNVWWKRRHSIIRLAFLFTVIILRHQTHACTELYLTNPFPHCNGQTRLAQMSGDWARRTTHEGIFFIIEINEKSCVCLGFVYLASALALRCKWITKCPAEKDDSIKSNKSE